MRATGITRIHKRTRTHTHAHTHIRTHTQDENPELYQEYVAWRSEVQTAAAADRDGGSSVVAGGRARLLTRKEVIKQGNGPRVTKVIGCVLWRCVWWVGMCLLVDCGGEAGGGGGG